MKLNISFQFQYQFRATRAHFGETVDHLSRIVAEQPTRVLSYQQALSLLPEITRVLSRQDSAYLSPLSLPFSTPRELTPRKLRETLMRTTCVGTFGDAGLSDASFSSVISSSADDGILGNITIDTISDMDVFKNHLHLHFNYLYRLTGDHTYAIRLFVNVSDSLAEDGRVYLESLLGDIWAKPGTRFDTVLSRVSMRETAGLFLTYVAK